jgi:hypothetical protein
METKNFITQWCLTDGILKLPVIKDGLSLFVEINKHQTYVHKDCIHDTLEQAQAHAEQMRLAEIEKLQSKITKLQELRF